MKFAPLKYNRPIDLPHSASHSCGKYCTQSLSSNCKYAILWLMPFICFFFSGVAEYNGWFSLCESNVGFRFHFHFQLVCLLRFFSSSSFFLLFVASDIKSLTIWMETGFFKSLIFILKKYVSVHVYGVNALSRTTTDTMCEFEVMLAFCPSSYVFYLRMHNGSDVHGMQRYTSSLMHIMIIRKKANIQTQITHQQQSNKNERSWIKTKANKTHTRFNNTCNLFHNWQSVIVDSYVHYKLKSSQ